MNYLGGTGVGGGTLMGLSKLLLRADNIEHIVEYAEGGDLQNVDLRIKDITARDSLSALSRDLTAANFGNVSDIASKEDIAKGILNLVFETVGMVSIFAAQKCGVKDIILTGNLTRIPFCTEKFSEFSGLCDTYGVRFMIPEMSQFSTVIGTALCGI
jgi:type II pantothenate kinase